MKSSFRAALRDTSIWIEYQRLRARPLIKTWHATGRPVPPPHGVKQQILERYADVFGTRIFVETGTYLGDMLAAVRKRFDRLISIELSKELAERARQRFSRYRHIAIVQGDSGAMLSNVIQQISQPTLFWLDGHYSDGVTARGEINTPIVSELKAILSHPVKGHVILIDDARLFDGTSDYPTIKEVQHLVQQMRSDLEFSVKNDIIRIHTRQDGPHSAL